MTRDRLRLAWKSAAAILVAAALAVWGAFDSADDAGWRAAGSALVALLAGILFTTALLLARGGQADRLARGVGCLAGVAALLTIVVIAGEDSVGDGYAKLLAVTWILTVLGYVLVPVVSRLDRVSVPSDERIVSRLGEIELVATTRDVGSAVDPLLQPGERLFLRRRV